MSLVEVKDMKMLREDFGSNTQRAFLESPRWHRVEKGNGALELQEGTLRFCLSGATSARYANAHLVNEDRETENAETQRTALNIRTPHVANQVQALSGGNQQKVVLAKWLSMRPRAIIFDEPTRGIDVGAKSEIYALMRDLANKGVAVLMISSDMEEVVGVSDRIAVMHEGSISGFLERSQFSEANVLKLAVGASLN